MNSLTNEDELRFFKFLEKNEKEMADNTETMNLVIQKIDQSRFFVIQQDSGFCCRVFLGYAKKEKGYYMLSVSIPPRGNGTQILETALVGPSGDLIYSEELGYEDVCCFSEPLPQGVEEVLGEIARVIEELQNSNLI